MEKYHVYVHRKKTDGNIFYVGKGSIYRSRSSCSRNRHWHCIVQKHGFYAEIISSFDNEKEAYHEEIRKINEIGLSNLCNVTKGGEGGPGFPGGELSPMYGMIGPLHPRFGLSHTNEQREHIKAGRAAGKDNSMSPEKIDELRKRMMGNTFSRGIKLSKETRDKISKSLSGEKNPSYKHDVFRFVHDSGDVFIGTRHQFCTSHDVSRGNVSSMINGKLKQTKGWRIDYETP